MFHSRSNIGTVLDEIAVNVLINVNLTLIKES